MYQRHFKVLALGLFTLVGCDQTQTDSLSKPPPSAPTKSDEVQRNADTMIKKTTTSLQENKDKLLKDLRAQMAIMDADIERLRMQGKDLESDAKTKWDEKMTILDEKRKLANEKLEAIGNSTSEAWSDIEKGVKTAWGDLTKAFQDASKEF